MNKSVSLFVLQKTKWKVFKIFFFRKEGKAVNEKINMPTVIIWRTQWINECVFICLFTVSIHYTYNFLLVLRSIYIYIIICSHKAFLSSDHFFPLLFLFLSCRKPWCCVVKCVILIWNVFFNYINSIVIVLSFYFYFFSFRTILRPIGKVCKLGLLFLTASRILIYHFHNLKNNFKMTFKSFSFFWQ